MKGVIRVDKVEQPRSERAVDQPEDFGSWVEPHLPAMAHLARRLAPAAEDHDVLQEALVRAWRHRSRFDPSRGALRSWLLKIVANEAKRTWRIARRRVLFGTQQLEDQEGDVSSAMWIRVQGLPWRQRQAVALYYYLDLSVRDVAEVMGCAEGTVKATLNAARNGIRQSFQESDNGHR